MLTATYYCTQPTCLKAITLAFTSDNPSFCPFCGTSHIITEQEHLRLAAVDWINAHYADSEVSVVLTPKVYDRLLRLYRQQDAFVSLNEYIGVMLFDAPIQGNTNNPTRKDMGDTGKPLAYDEAMQKLPVQRVHDEKARVTHAERMSIKRTVEEANKAAAHT